jgi:transcription elongation factor Elf1
VPEPRAPFSCPLCGSTASEPAVITRGDGTSSDGWLRCAQCRRYSVSMRPGEPFVPAYAKRRR